MKALHFIRHGLIGIIVGLMLGSGFAALAQIIGQPPAVGSGQQLIDGTWLLGVTGGGNRQAASGIIAHAGGTQAAGFQLPANVALISVDTVATTGDSVLLPFCVGGQVIDLSNTGAQTLNVYANPNTNRATATTDTINASTNTTAYTLTTNQAARFFCPKAGVWKAIKTA